MPVKWGGMAFRNPVKTACNSFKDSVNATCMITHAIKNGHKLDVHEHNGHAIKALKESKAVRDNCFEIQSETVIEQLPTRQQKVLKRILDGNMSSWLSVLPTQQDGYDLSAQQFRDQLAMRYGREPLNLPSLCDGCDHDFSLWHALECKKGGLVKKGHDNLRDVCVRLSDMAWGGCNS